MGRRGLVDVGPEIFVMTCRSEARRSWRGWKRPTGVAEPRRSSHVRHHHERIQLLTAVATSPSLRRATVTSGLIGAAVTTAAAGAVHAAGVSFEIDGETIPILGFAQMTFIGAVIGGLLMVALNRWSDRPRRRFVQISVALTAVSCLPSIAMPDDAGSVIALVALHVLAAAIIVPVLARHATS